MDSSHFFRHAMLLPALAGLMASTASAQFVLGTDQGLGMDDAEITPDGRFAVVRENLGMAGSRIYDMATGQLVARYNCAISGTVYAMGAQDAVVVTNDRAVVLGYCTIILDLTNPGTAIATFVTGSDTRDLALTPDGSRVAIRGGRGGPGMTDPGGLFIADVQTGAVLVNTPGLPTSAFQMFDVDSVVASDDYAAFVSLVSTPTGPQTRVTIFDIFTPPSGMPTIVYETTLAGIDVDQAGNPHDIAITPDGRHVAVRSGQSVGLYELNGIQTRRVWHKRLFGEPGPFGNSAMDSIEVTNDWIATISRDSNGGFAAQVDLFDMQGNQRFDDIPGDPHDLAFMPGAEQFLVRTSSGLFLYDLTSVPAGPRVPFAASQAMLSTHTSFGAGLDSLVVVDGTAVTLTRMGTSTDVDIWDVGAASLAFRAGGVLPGLPVDLDISPNGRLVAVSGLVNAQVYDLSTGDLLLEHTASTGAGNFPWCDGVALNDDSLVAFGYSGPQSGWVTIIDLFSAQVPYCPASPNSVGDGATMYATGSPSAGSNDLELIARDLPPNRGAQFVYGAAQVNLPFGDGQLCVGGQAYRFPYQQIDAQGVARRTVDNTGVLRIGGAIMAGTTWNFQLLYRDPAGSGGTGGAGFNTSDGIQIAFDS
ncbi:MAG: hypothetical protein ACI8QZ_003804 [Chlamydiales bacterium]|jgi:hypothetical protein